MNTGYIIQEPPKRKGKNKHKKVYMIRTLRGTKGESIHKLIKHTNTTWSKAYTIGWRCVKVNIIPVK